MFLKQDSSSHDFTSSPFHAAPPPWVLTGSAAAFLSTRGVIMLTHYQSSPVGPYDEWSRVVLTLRGPRVMEMFVTSPNSMRGGRENWGFPKHLAKLLWQQRGRHIHFHADNAMYRLRGWGPHLPLNIGGFCVQTLNGQDVRVPMHIKAKARVAWRGKQIALLVEDFVFTVEGPQPLKN